MKNTQPSSRSARVTRSVFIALIATIIAASSHMVAGGNTPTLVALIATAAISLPLVTLLATKRAGLIGTLIAVSITQALFHTVFVYAGTGVTIDARPAEPLHAAHMRAFESFVPTIGAADLSHNSGLLMWIMHALASLATVWLIRSGEEALSRLGLSLSRIVLPRPITLAHKPVELPALTNFSPAPKITSLIFTDAQTLRGPPVTA